jgi:repressor LexA
MGKLTLAVGEHFWDISQMHDSLLQRELRRRMEAAGYNQKSLARAAGLNQTAVRDILKGRSRHPRSDTLEALARILGCTIDQLTGRPDFAAVTVGATTKVNVVGRVQAGEWVEAFESPPDDWYAIDAPLDERFRGIPRFALKVLGPSMNRLYAEGDVVVCVRIADAGRMPRSGERVIVQRSNAQGMIEATIKEYVVDEDGNVWLWPRSNHPEFQQPYLLRPQRDRSEPIREKVEGAEPPRFHEVFSDEFEIVALVIGSYRRE